MDQSWFESCAEAAEPCQPAVWKVKMWPLKSSDVLFVTHQSAHKKEVLWCKGVTCAFHNKVDASFCFFRQSDPHRVAWWRSV